MPRYIVKPRRFSDLDQLTQFAHDAGPLTESNGAKASRLKALQDMRASTASFREMNEYIAKISKIDTTVLKRTESIFPLTDSTVLDMPTERADEFKREIGNVDIILDRELHLIEPDRRKLRRTKHLLDDQKWHLTAIGLKDARARGIQRTGQGVVAAVLDTGIDSTVPDLEGRVRDSYVVDPTTYAIQRTGNPCIDTLPDGHGTQVAGLICGKEVGVAPGAQVVNVTILKQGRGWLSNFILALEHVATTSNIDVVNISSGIIGFMPEMQDIMLTLLALNIIPVVAVGNEGRHRTRSPGNYRDVVSVGAMTKQYRVASFSGNATISLNNQIYSVPDLVAPGDSVYSCIPGGEYEAADGTSFAAPIVTGVACLAIERFKANNLSVNAIDLIEKIPEDCRTLDAPLDRQGNGLIQVI